MCNCNCGTISIIFNITVLTILYIYPLSEAFKKIKENNPSRLYAFYFSIVALFFFLESTILIPFVFLLDSICIYLYPSFKSLVFLWLYYPEYRGALYIDEKISTIFDKYFPLINSKVSPIMEGILGFPTRS